MTKSQIPHKSRIPPSAQPYQINIAFESSMLRGLTSVQRMKAVMQLSRVLMLAAGVAPKESGDER